METPKWNFESTEDVYEPAEDSFLLLDALEDDLNQIKDIRPSVIVEIGSGSGVIISALAKALESSAFCVAIDINSSACQVTKETALLNSVQLVILLIKGTMCFLASPTGLACVQGFLSWPVQLDNIRKALLIARVDVLQGDLLGCVKSCGLIDVLVFNPPYVVTPDDEISGSIERSWAGGANGRLVIDRLLNNLHPLLASRALFYLVVIKENNPKEILDIMGRNGFTGGQVNFRKVRGEQLSVLRFTKK